MKKLIAALFLLLALPALALAQTSVITGQACNVQLSNCTLSDDAGDTISVKGAFVYSGAVSVAVIDASGAASGHTCLASTSFVSSTNYRQLYDLTVSCEDGAALTGTFSRTRSGSGRGGWAWHAHVAFETYTPVPGSAGGASVLGVQQKPWFVD